VKRLGPLELSFFALESAARPMHAGGVLVFDPPQDGGCDLVERVVAAFRAARPVPPWNQRPVFGLSSLPHWETVPEFDIDYHLRRIGLPAPGSHEQLMNLVSQLYPGQLDRSRPLWDATLIEGLAGGRLALFFKAHHALADGASGLRMFHAALTASPNDDPRPLWAASPERTAEPRIARESGSLEVIGTTLRRAVAGASSAVPELAKLVPATIRLMGSGSTMPFSAARSPRTSERITSSRSFASFTIPRDVAKQIATAAGGTVNDVLLSVCDDALQRYHRSSGAAGDKPLTAMLAVSTRQAGDDSSSNSVAGMLVTLATPGAGPARRLDQIVTATSHAKSVLRQTPAPMLQLQILGLMSVMEFREQLPVGRGTVPHVVNFTLSNIPGGLPETRYLGRAELTALYVIPIVPAAQELNFTALTYRNSICVGIGAARNIVPDTERLARLASESFEDLRRDLPPKV
jgi:WS/DGAT/MGAT family acyltransferase